MCLERLTGAESARRGLRIQKPTRDPSRCIGRCRLDPRLLSGAALPGLLNRGRAVNPRPDGQTHSSSPLGVQTWARGSPSLPGTLPTTRSAAAPLDARCERQSVTVCRFRQPSWLAAHARKVSKHLDSEERQCRIPRLPASLPRQSCDLRELDVLFVAIERVVKSVEEHTLPALLFEVSLEQG